MKYKVLIIGSGIGGLSAAAELKSRGIEDFKVVDRTPSLPLNLHNGVHYLHTNDFGTPFPFKFQEIRSKEQIWHPVKDIWKNQADLPEINEYGIKAFDIRHPSSIMDPGNRAWKTFIPMSNNMNDLIQAYHDYVGKEKFEWGYKLLSVDKEEKIATFEKDGLKLTIEYENMITTAPMNTFEELFGIKIDKPLEHRTVHVTNYKTTGIIPNWLVGIYIPDMDFPPYRITILNNIISMESSHKLTQEDEYNIKYHLGKQYDYELDTKTEYSWDTGRIWGLRPWDREKVVRELVEKDIYPLGRYGLWNGKLTMDTTAIQARDIVEFLVYPGMENEVIINNLKG